MGSADAEELGAGIAMGAEPLAGEIGHEEQPLGTRRRFRRLGDDLFIARLFLVKGAAGPAHGVAPDSSSMKAPH